MISDGLPAEGIVAAFEFAERRQVRWQLGYQATSMAPGWGRLHFRCWRLADVEAAAGECLLLEQLQT